MDPHYKSQGVILSVVDGGTGSRQSFHPWPWLFPGAETKGFVTGLEVAVTLDLRDQLCTG